MTTSCQKAILLILHAVLVLSVPVNLRAQHLQASLSHYSTDNGLCSNAIAALHQDDFGFVWLATWNGVSRFDGYDFYNYKTGISSGIRGMHNRIDNMTIDLSQNIWLKMYDGRIFVINRMTDRIEDPMEGIGGHNEFCADYFFNPYVTSNSDVLIFFKDVGLYKLKLDRFGIKQDLIITGNLTVSCIVEGYRGDLWAGTNEGVRRIDMANMSLEKKGYFTDEHITYLATNGYTIFAGTKSGKIMQFSYGQEPKLLKDIGKEITSLFIDSHGLLWFSDLGDGAYRLIPETGDVKYFTQRLLVPEFTSRGAEFSEAMGVVWLRLNHGGYGYYNREADEIEYFHNDPSNPWNLSNSVNACLEMDEGVVWESTNRRGLEKLEVLKNTIMRKLLVPNAESPLENEVRAMHHDPKRHLTFLCNKKGCIYVFDAKGNRSVITHDSNGHPISRPYGMSGDSKGNYWVCDKDNGLYKITPNEKGGFTVVNFHHDEKDPYSLSSNAAYQTVEDKNGNIWVATYGGGVNVLRKDKNGKYIALHKNNVMKSYPTNGHLKVRTIALAKDGKVWAGSTDGILTFELRNNAITIQPLKRTEKLEDDLMSTDIVTLALDKKGVMWIGTNSGGLSCTAGTDEEGFWKFKNYGVQDGMPSEEIRSITFDNDGNVWIGTDHIICSFNVSKKIFTSFSNLDGVDDTMLSEGSAITLSNGNIIFGTLNGYYTVDRKKLTTSTGSLLKLHITDFYLNDELQSPRLNDNYDYYVPQSRQVVIPYHGCKFSFRFAALNYQLQHRVHYQYKLEGYDEDWRTADKTRMASYKDLPTGTYYFQVKAFLLESPNAYDMRTIEVTVPPPFLLSSTAVWIYMALLLIGLLAALWWYQEKIRKEYKAANPDTEDIDDFLMEEQEEEKEEDTDEYELMDNEQNH
jgi:ligand-binding sensor domain-containing protein